MFVQSLYLIVINEVITITLYLFFTLLRARVVVDRRPSRRTPCCRGRDPRDPQCVDPPDACRAKGGSVKPLRTRQPVVSRSSDAAIATGTSKREARRREARYGQVGAASAAGAAGAAAALASVHLNPRNPGGDWTAQAAEPGGSSPRLSTGGRIPAPRVAAAAVAEPLPLEVVGHGGDRSTDDVVAEVADELTCPLLDPLQKHPDLFQEEILERLTTPMHRTMLAQVGKPWLAAVLASGLSRVRNYGYSGQRLKLAEYCTSVERLAWAKANGCPWDDIEFHEVNNCCTHAAAGGHLAVLRWARAEGCAWNEHMCRRRSRRAPGCAEMGAGAWVPVERVYV